MQLASLIIASLVAIHPVQVIAASNCSGSDQWTYCSTDTSLEIGVSETVPGSGGNAGNQNHNSSGGGGSGGGNAARPPMEDIPLSDDMNEWCSEALTPCREPTVDEEPTASIEDITLSDLASFRPTPPTITGEPLGFGLVGAPTNLLGRASAEQFPATILSLDVTVRFEPERFIFDNGDGTTTTTATGGTEWGALALPQFSPTDTSHIYTASGTYSAALTVEYAPYVTVDPANGWLRVSGSITATAGSYPIRVVEAHTALVDQTCTQNPHAAGC